MFDCLVMSACDNSRQADNSENRIHDFSFASLYLTIIHRSGGEYPFTVDT